MLPLATLGSAGMGAAGGVGTPSSSTASSATSRSGDIRTTYEGNSIGGGAGARAFQNFVNFADGVQNVEAESQGGNAMNPPALGGVNSTNAILIFGIIAAVVFLAGLLRR